MPFPHISRNPGILAGKPVITGTRISVDFILETLAAGLSVADMVQEYPGLTPMLVREALAYAAVEIQQVQLEALPAFP